MCVSTATWCSSAAALYFLGVCENRRLFVYHAVSLPLGLLCNAAGVPYLLSRIR